MNELQNMMVFATVLETGSFSRAADKLGIAKSSVSKKISELERDMGVRLIQRSTRKLNMTEEGEALYQHCRQIRQQLELARQDLSRYRGAPQGTLRIGVSPLFGNTVIAPLIPAFQELYPEVAVELHYSEQMADLIGEGYDLSLRMGSLADSSLVAVELFTVQSVLCAAPAYLDRHGRPQHPGDIEQHNFLRWLAPNRPPYMSLVFHKGSRQFSSKIRSQFSSNDAQATREVAINGGGLSLLPNYSVYQQIQAGELELLLADYRVHEFPVSLVYPQRKQIPPKVRAFSDYLKERLQAQDFSALNE